MTRILCITLLLMFSIYGVRHCGTFANPVVAVCVPFAAALIAQQLFLPQMPFGFRGFALITASTAAFTMGALVVRVGNSPPLVRLGVRPGRRRVTSALGLVLSVTTLIASVYAGHIVSRPVAGHVRPGLFSRELALAALSGKDQLVLRAITLLVLGASAYCILLWRARAPLSRISVVLVTVASVEFAASIRTRLPTLLVFFLFGLSILLTSQMAVTRMLPRMRKIGIIVIGAAVLLVASFGVFVNVAELRHGDFEDPRSFVISAFGGPSALAVWLDEPDTVYQPTSEDGQWEFGVSVGGWLDLLGLRPRELGQASSVVLVPSMPDGYTNVYTGLFYLAQDFTLLGVVVLLGAVGASTSALEARYRRQPSVASLVLRLTVYLGLATLPNFLITYYNFWWLLLFGAIIVPSFLVLVPTAPVSPLPEYRHPSPTLRP